MKKLPGWVIILGAMTITGIITLLTMKSAVKPEIIVAGELHIKEGLQIDALNNRTLFIVLYSEDPNKPMPLGVMREAVTVSQAGKIRRYSVTPSKVQAMMSKDPIPQVFRIKARLDRDGAGGRDQPGDIIGEVSGVTYGSEDITINFNKKI